jgi:hypothetical protein
VLEEMRYVVGRRHDLLEVVEEQEQLAPPKLLRECHAELLFTGERDTECANNRLERRPGVPHGR